MAKRRIKTIDQLLRNPPPACTCDRCRYDCHIPCWGTPEQIQRIIDAGYGSRLSMALELTDHPIWVLCPAVKGREEGFTPLAGIDFINYQGCTFWNLDGRELCDLHDRGLKPVEGRMTHHDPKYKCSDWLRDWIVKQWDNRPAQTIVARWAMEHMPDLLEKHAYLKQAREESEASS